MKNLLSTIVVCFMVIGFSSCSKADDQTSSRYEQAEQKIKARQAEKAAQKNESAIKAVDKTSEEPVQKSPEFKKSSSGTPMCDTQEVIDQALKNYRPIAVESAKKYYVAKLMQDSHGLAQYADKKEVEQGLSNFMSTVNPKISNVRITKLDEPLKKSICIGTLAVTDKIGKEVNIIAQATATGTYVEIH